MGQAEIKSESPTVTKTMLDAVVIGAGIAGLYQLYRMREMGLKVRAYEAGSASAEPGTGIAIPVLASIPKSRSTNTGSRRICIKRGSPANAFPRSPRPSNG